MTGPSPDAPGRRRLLRRGPCENATIGIIALGMFMLMQPFSLALYGYSFVTILAGTVGFMVASKLAD